MAGVRLRLLPETDGAASVVGLALLIRRDLGNGDDVAPVRRAAELATRFEHVTPAIRCRMIAAAPPQTGDPRWDTFVAALAEWLAVRGGITTPEWVWDEDRTLGRGWWVTPMRSMRAWEYAGSPASFKNRGVYLHRDSLTNV